MEDSNTSFPGTAIQQQQQQREREQENQEQKQLATLAFIEHRLPAFHPAFVDPPVHWDKMSNQYAPNNININNSNSLNLREAFATLPVPDNKYGSNLRAASLYSSSSLPVESLLPPRLASTDVNAMTFWNSIFNDARAKFIAMPEPKGRSSTRYSIRDKADWDAVYATLELAQEKYKTEGGPVGWLRKIRRKAADNIAPLAAAAKTAQGAIPNNLYSTPVLGAVGVILDAVKQAALVRKQALSGFEKLITTFSDIEVFLGTFCKDTNIINASVELTTIILDAIEKVIGFFISNEFKRASKAALRGGEYETDLLNSLEEINTKSTMLMGEAEKSHIHESHQAHLFSQEMQIMMATRQWQMDETQKHMDETQKHMDETQKQMAEKQQLIVKKQDIQVDLLNAAIKLFRDHKTEQDALITAHKYLAAKDIQIANLQREVRSADQRFISTQEMNTYLAVDNQRLRSRSASPMLSLLVLPPPEPEKPIMKWSMSQDILQDILDRILDTSEFNTIDMAFISNKKGQLPEKQRARVEQIVNTPLFRNWIVSASSTKLLVQWDSRFPKTIAEVSPLSVFCVSMVHLLADKERFISIQWFCGRHLDPVVMDVSGSPISSGRAMLLDLVSQLLRAHTFNTHSLSLVCDPISLIEGHINNVGLRALFSWLVHQLPQTTTLICFIDGVLLYERPNHGDDALSVLAFLLKLTTAEEGVAASFKVLFTSTPGPRKVRVAFEDEGLILNVDTLPQVETTVSEVRMARGLGVV